MDQGTSSNPGSDLEHGAFTFIIFASTACPPPVHQNENSHNRTIENALRLSLDDSSIACFHDKSLIPMYAIIATLEAVNISNVISEVRTGLSESDVSRYTDIISGSSGNEPSRPAAIKILALLILCQMSHFIVEFIDAGFDDSDLPLRFKYDTGSDGNVQVFPQAASKPPLLLTGLSNPGVLEQTHHRISLPFLSRSLPLGRKLEVLPFLNSKRFGCGLGGGGVARSWKTKIHPRYSNLPTLTTEKGDQEYLVNLLSEGRHLTVDVAELVNNIHKAADYPHIFRILDCVEYLGQRHIISFWPYQDMSAYFEANPSPDITRGLSIWLSSQLQGLAKLLCATENLRPFLISSSNILWLHNQGYDHFTNIADGTLQLDVLDAAFMEIREFNREEFRSNVPEHTCGRTAWFPSLVNNVRFNKQGDLDSSQSIEVWSRAYSALTCVTWLLTGPDGIRNLDDQHKEAFHEIEGSRFRYRLEQQEPFIYTPERSVIPHHIATLKDHPKCSGYLYDLLNVVDKTVVGKNGKRLGIVELEKNMAALGGQLISRPKSYACQPRASRKGVKGLVGDLLGKWKGKASSS